MVPMSRSRLVLGVSILVLMGLAAGAIVFHGRKRGGAAAARAFLAAERRSLLGTWVVEQRLTRLVSSRPGQPLVVPIHDAQRPPDHLITAPGTVDSVYGGRRMACGAGPDGVLRCRDAGVDRPYPAQVDATIASLATYVEGPSPPYSVRDAGRGCFVVRLGPNRPASTLFGTRARLCFDPATSAPVRTEVDRAEGQDVTVAVSVSATVTDEDLRPPA